MRASREAGGGQLLTMVTHVVPQQPLSGESLGTVRALEALLWGGKEKERVDGGDGGEVERTNPREGTIPGRREPPEETRGV